mgnify:CR=1 FL=1
MVLDPYSDLRKESRFVKYGFVSSSWSSPPHVPGSWPKGPSLASFFASAFALLALIRSFCSGDSETVLDAEVFGVDEESLPADCPEVVFVDFAFVKKDDSDACRLNGIVS